MSDEDKVTRAGLNKDPDKAIQGPINEKSIEPADFFENGGEDKATKTASKHQDHAE